MSRTPTRRLNDLSLPDPPRLPRECARVRVPGGHLDEALCAVAAKP